tara:strand:- start:254 stop:514 length:261 start_codon:yes stop_codon:yes gene_type:complete
MITAALNGVLNNVGYRTHSLFGAEIPTTCPGVPSEILSPRETWKDDEAFYKKANELVIKFQRNFDKYRDESDETILQGEPQQNLKY